MNDASPSPTILRNILRSYGFSENELRRFGMGKSPTQHTILPDDEDACKEDKGEALHYTASCLVI